MLSKTVPKLVLEQKMENIKPVPMHCMHCVVMCRYAFGEIMKSTKYIKVLSNVYVKGLLHNFHIFSSFRALFAGAYAILWEGQGAV